MTRPDPYPNPPPIDDERPVVYLPGMPIFPPLVLEEGDLLADALRKARERAGLSQVSAAIRLGVLPTTVHIWESGRKRPRLANLLKMADLYRVDKKILLDLYSEEK